MRPALAVPPIYAPIPPAVHPSHKAIDARTAAWADRFNIGSPEWRRRLVTQDIGVFAARILPEGREEVVSVLSDFVIWLFGVDDGYCEEGELGIKPGELAATLSRLLRVAQNPEVTMLSGDPLAEGLRDLTLRVSRWGTPLQTARWVDTLREYFFAVVWEAEHRAAGRIPGLNDYALMRLYVGATSVVPPFLEMGHGYELQPHERDSKAVRAAGEMTSFITTWDNDIYSHHKESRGANYYLNVIRVLEHEYGLSPHQALTRAIAQRDRVMCLFLSLRAKLEDEGSPQVRQYLASLASFIRATQDWSVSSLRYTTPDDPAALSSSFSDRPTDTSREPLDIPSISWWWDLVPASRTAPLNDAAA
ncbi:selina-4(15),7(11)-diene synthase [Streptomyces sp. HNM0645]|uniref:selina-4(15),7(11)-diene synthase n=1 Tax=Streptomyces sp. HNM0645 TaxID=2782343 RepID=UPI0024B86434|nr:selina-4(15),7(11)-diene synthase [Streptomyces sp. HNM0645]MDI9888896.1 selina-4(15),7(11)-diene synthase [Streptomyces sp. HNM0645]